MFFVAKATLCIGLVAAVASQTGGGSLATALDRDAREAAASVGRACLASSDCLRVGAGLVAATSDRPVPAPEQGLARRRAATPPAPSRRGDEPRHRDTMDRAALQGRAAAHG